MDITQFQQARFSRDPRFDGVFYIAVKTTGIFCRPICPATPPKEENVEYFETASEALVSGYRPCLRCRPESAPFSPAWNGTATTVKRALDIIHSKGFHGIKLSELAEKLGITDRYLRKLFEQQIGIGPKGYMQHQQILFAKSLLHQTHMAVNDIAYASGFNNVRRFNDAFKRITKKTPSEVRKRNVSDAPIRLIFNYQPPYDWAHLQQFLSLRLMNSVEKLGSSSYGRNFHYFDGSEYQKGHFSATHRPDKNAFNVSIELENSHQLYPVSQTIRRVLDLNANTGLIEQHLVEAGFPKQDIISGLRIPGCWSTYEAMIKAILGQQVSVKAATNLTNELIDHLGDQQEVNGELQKWFPLPAQIVKSKLDFLKIPSARKQTLIDVAKYFDNNPAAEASELIEIKGVGPWTIDYAKMRGQSNTDIWLDTDLGIKKALDIFPSIEQSKAQPWRSYLTFQMWGML